VKQTILKIVNIILAILILSQFLSGFFRKLIGKELFDLIHEKGALVLIAVLVIHILFNWGWIKNTYFRKKQ